MIKTMNINEVIKPAFVKGVGMPRPKKSSECLARVPNIRNPKRIKFCKQPSKFNDLCEKHDRKLIRSANNSYFNLSLK